MDVNYKFPKNFKWGSAVWGQGTEGAFDKDGKAPTVWDEYYKRSPEKFFNEIGPNDTLNWYKNYQEFADLAKDIAHNSFRTSILWARLIPDGKTINQKAVEFYRKMFKAFKKNGMHLSIVLYWFDMPLLYEEKGGFTSREIISDFTYYCKTCFDLFDDLVDIWYVYNEPIIDVCFKYQDDMCYPNKNDFNLAINAIYNMVVAHAEVVKIFKEKPYRARIGCVLNRSVAYEKSDSEEDLLAAKMMETLFFECFETPLLKGYINPLWYKTVTTHGAKLDIRKADKNLIKDNTISILGLNTYSCERVMATKLKFDSETRVNFGFSSQMFYSPYTLPEAKMNNDRGWEIYPKVMYDTLMKMKHLYGNLEMYITENGIGIQNENRYRNKDGEIQDDYRIEYVEEHLKYALLAIKDGVNLKGYNMWSFIDLWSPTNQFKNCYGFYEYDLNSCQTKKKKSANWFKNVIENNGF